MRQQSDTSPSAKRILVAEKNQAFQKSLKNFLIDEGFVPTMVSTGEEALLEIQNNPPDLCLLEIIIPKLLGTEVCLTVKQKKPLTNIPIILMSSGVKEFDGLSIPDQEFRADDYLLKPFSQQILLEKIRTNLTKTNPKEPELRKVKDFTVTRENARVPLNIVVDYESANIFFSSQTMNISKGGFFIRTNNPLPMGQVIKLNFTLPDQKRSIQGYGRVVWIEKPKEHKLAGMGIRFKDFESEDVKTIYSYVQRLKELVH